MTSAEVLREYASGRRDFAGVDVQDDGADTPGFTHADLEGINFANAYIVASFEYARLRRARFQGANVKTCSFRFADLTGADFSDAALDATTFRGARLVRTRFSGATVYGHTMAAGELPDW